MMVKVYLILIFITNFISSFCNFKLENRTQAILDSLIFFIAISLFINYNFPNHWFIILMSCLYGLGVAVGFSTAPKWATIYRLLICLFGLYLLG